MPENEPLCARGSLHGKVLAIEILTKEIRDADTSYALRDEVMALVDGAEPDHIVLDFQHVTFVGSIGFLAFLTLRRRLQNGRIVICNLSDTIYRVFEICRLIAKDTSASNPFLVANTFEEAVARCSE